MIKRNNSVFLVKRYKSLVVLIILIGCFSCSNFISTDFYDNSQCLENRQASSSPEQSEFNFQQNFVENDGIVNSSDVYFLSYIDTILVYLTDNSVCLRDTPTNLYREIEFKNSQPSQPIGILPHESSYHYFLGSRGTFSNVASYGGVLYKGIWAHIDLELYSTSDGLRFEYVIHPGGDVSDIQLSTKRQDGTEATNRGFRTCITDDSLIDAHIQGYQDNSPVSVECIKVNDDTFGFHASTYDSLSSLTIESLLFSSYIGGSGSETGRDIAVDSLGNIYVTGSVTSVDFPLVGPYDSVLNADGSSAYTDCFVMKFDSNRNLVYSTFIGGTLADGGFAIAVNDLGEVYVTGRTKSSDFPVKTAFDDTFGGGNSYDCFLFKLNATGNGLVFSTYIGGSFGDEGFGICIDDDGNVYITGITESQFFPTLNAYDDSYNTGWDCFVLMMNSTGTGLVYSTFIGGTFSFTPPFADRNDFAEAIAVDSYGNAFVTGYTNSQSFPTVNAYNDTLSSWNIDDCFVFKLNATGNGLIYSTYIGGTGQDQATDISIDAEGCAYITGSTQSTDFPLVNAYDEDLNGASDSFLVKLSPEGNQLLYSSLLGGNGIDSGQSLVCDELDNIYLGGITNSSDFPVVNGVAYNGNGSASCFVLKLNLTSNSILYSTCVGGSMDDSLLSLIIDSYGTVYATGSTYSDDFPMVNSYDSTQNGASDVFVFLLPDFGDSDSDGIPDYNESLYGTNRFSADSDLDDLSDYQEVFIYLTNPLSNDSDSDTLDDFSEVMVYHTNPLSNDTDSDHMSDEWEVLYSLDPLDPTDAGLDPDGDMLSNLGEYQNGTLPNNWDTDSDMMSDGWEVQYGLNPLDPTDATGDLDADSLTNLQEYENGTNPRSSDSDLDGIPDDWEVSMGFDPLNPEVPLLEFLLYNFQITILLCMIIVGVCVGIFYLLRPRLEERRMKKEQELEEKEIQTVIHELSVDSDDEVQVDSDAVEDEDDTNSPEI